MSNRVVQWAAELPVSSIDAFWLRSMDKERYQPTDEVSWEDFWEYERLSWVCERKDALTSGFLTEEEAVTLDGIFQNPTVASIPQRFVAYRCLWIVFHLNHKHNKGYKNLDEAWHDQQQLMRWREEMSYQDDGMSW